FFNPLGHASTWTRSLAVPEFIHVSRAILLAHAAFCSSLIPFSSSGYISARDLHWARGPHCSLVICRWNMYLRRFSLRSTLRRTCAGTLGSLSCLAARY